MTRIFVTGSGTEVGKTFVCCRLLEALAGTVTVRAVKPVASGFDPAMPQTSDTAALLAAQNLVVDAAAIERTTPWRFAAPLSPDMAANREGRQVPFDELVAWSRRDDGADVTLIEGIGGALVPLDEQHTVLDWIAAVDAAIWLVCGTYLGSISHALATLAAIETRSLDVTAIVLGESAEAAAPLDEIAAVIERFAGGTPVIPLGRPPSAAQLAALATLARATAGR